MSHMEITSNADTATANEVLIDALPYVDRQLDEEGVRDNVEKLIEQEMKTFQFEEQNRLPTIPTDVLTPSEDGALWKVTLEHMKDGKEKLNALDMSRYRMPTALEDDADLKAWQELCQSTEAQLQHQNSRLCNLELLQKFGNNAWRLHNYQVEGQVEIVKRVLEAEKSKVIECNQARKAMQLEAGEKLRKLEERWQSLIGQNAHLEVACAALEKEINDWKAYKVNLTNYEQQRQQQ